MAPRDGIGRPSGTRASAAGPALGYASRAFRTLWARIAQLAAYPGLTITLEGESGTGKTYLARAIHDLSPRANAPYVDVDVGTLDDAIAGSELFGHVSGAFTGATGSRRGLVATAHGGTLFLDEIGKASPTVQKRLLNLIEKRAARPIGADRAVTYDVRFIVATNVPLETLVERQELLPDLVPRLSAFRLRVPPLRERRDDIPLLARTLLDKHAALLGYGAVPTLSPALEQALCACDWPSNVRELDNVIQRLLVAAQGAPVVGLEHCMDEDLIALRRLDLGHEDSCRLTPDAAVEAVRRSRSISQAARDLGVARSTVQRQLRRAAPDTLEDVV